MTMSENKYMIMDETIRPFEPGEPGYELLLKLEPVFAEIDKKILAKKRFKRKKSD